MSLSLEYKGLLERSLNFGYANRVRVEQGLVYFYKHLNLPEPKVICFETPLQLQLAIKQVLKKPKSLCINNASFDELDEFLKSDFSGARTNTLLWHHISDNAARALKIAFAKEEGLMALHNRLKPVFSKVELAVQRKLERNLAEVGEKVELFAHHPHYFDLKWLLHYQGRIDTIEHSKVLFDIIDAGLMYCYNFENLVLWCPLPREVNFDSDSLELHHENLPSLAWDQRFQLFYWKGVEVPRKLIEAPDLIQKSDLTKIRNAEVRRCFQEKLGSARFASFFDLVQIDSDRDLQGNMQRLYRSANIDILAKEHLQFAEVTCPSTGRIYFLSVPPDITNVWEAVAWTFGKTQDEYKPKAEL